MTSPATSSDFERLCSLVQTMTQSMTDSVAAQTLAVQELAAAVNEQRNVDSSRASGGRAEVHVNAGGVAVWVAATSAAVMLAIMIPLALALLWVAMDNRDRGHQMNALYMSVPGLRELVEKQMQVNEATIESAANQQEKSK